MIIGVLALQGDFDAHRRRLEELGATTDRLTPRDLPQLLTDRISLPYGHVLNLPLPPKGLA